MKKSTSINLNKPALGAILKRAVGITSVVTLAMSTALAPLATLPAAAKSAQRNYIKITSENANVSRLINLGLNKSIVVDLPADAHDILVANPDVADAVTRTSRRIYIFGKEIGQTNIFVFDGRGKQIAAMELVIERDIAGLEETIRRLVPQSDVRAEMINDNIVLTGSVPTPQAGAKVLRLANIFITGGENTQNSQSSNSGGTTILFGQDEPTSQIVNLLKIQGEDQVHLKVTVAELQRSVVKSLGLTAFGANPNTDGFGFGLVGGGLPSATAIGTNFPSTATTALAQTGFLSLTHGQNLLQSSISALEQAGVMRTLAEPSLSAVSGEKAHFRVGGGFPIQQSVDNNGVITFAEREYGIALTFTPVVLTEGRINLKIRTEVSEPTAQGATTSRPDVNIPGIRRRLADTTVELPSGGSMVIAGLIQDDVRQVVSGFPGLKNIPVLGSLFRSKEFIRNETEVVIIVTPYLVRPVARNKLAQPDENFAAASDAAGYFMGRINRVYGTKQGKLPKGRYTGSVGFILR